MRHYALDEDHAKRSLELHDVSVGFYLLASIITGVIAIFALQATLDRDSVPWLSVVLLTYCLTRLGFAHLRRWGAHRKFRAARRLGPLLSVGDEGVGMAGELVAWGDLRSVAIIDYRDAQTQELLGEGLAVPQPAGVVLDNSTEDQYEVFDLTGFLSSASLDKAFADLRATAEENGTPVVTAHTADELQAWTRQTNPPQGR